jgi:hypothetical protein
MPKALLTGGWHIAGAAPAAAGALGAASPPPSPPLPPATPALALNTTMRVLCVSGATLFESTAGAGHFSVTAAEHGEHRICVRADGGAVHASLDVKTAVEVADHTLAVRPEHVAAVRARQPPLGQRRRARLPSTALHPPILRRPLQPPHSNATNIFPFDRVSLNPAQVSAELDRMEELAQHVHQEMATMRRRADEADALDVSIRGRWVARRSTPRPSGAAQRRTREGRCGTSIAGAVEAHVETWAGTRGTGWSRQSERRLRCMRPPNTSRPSLPD